MKRLACLLALLAAPLFAQERMAQEDCLAAQTKVARSLGLPADLPNPEIDEEGWCLITGAVLPQTDATSFQIGSLRWRASDIARFINDTLPPRGIDVEASDINIVTQTGDEVFDYLLRVQMSTMNVSFAASLRWDGVQNAVTLSDTFIDFDFGNRIELSGRVEGVDLTDMASITASGGTAGLRSLTVRSQFNGWFEVYVAMPIGTALLRQNGTPPQAQVDALKAQAVAALEWLPEGNMPSASKEAFAAFITALPTPRGDARLVLSAQPVIGALRAVGVSSLMTGPATPQEITEAALEGVTAQFTWIQTEPEQ